MNYRVTITKEYKGLNELLNGRFFDSRRRKYLNPVKQRNDYVCVEAIRKSDLANIHIDKPIIIHYAIYAKDKKHDKMNLLSAIDKSFEDALQKCGVIDNDGWNDIENITHSFCVDRQNPRVEIVVEEIFLNK